MENNPNPIPEDVLKTWEDSAKKYAEQITRNINGFAYNSQLKDYAHLGYIQGRQDEWRENEYECNSLREADATTIMEQQKEIERLKGLIETAFYSGWDGKTCTLDSSTIKVRNTSSFMYFQDFKQQHNL